MRLLSKELNNFLEYLHHQINMKNRGETLMRNLPFFQAEINQKSEEIDKMIEEFNDIRRRDVYVLLVEEFTDILNNRD